jgi:ATP-binding cassette subfamily F protein uup
LQDILGDYDGTVLLVSHDRDFIDRIATSTIAMEGRGRATVYPGGWSDYQAQRVVSGGIQTADNSAKSAAPVAGKPAAKKAEGLTFTERKRLEALPGLIERLEAEIGRLADFLSDPEMFTKEPVKFRKAGEAMSERQAQLAAAEEEWLDLAARD